MGKCQKFAKYECPAGYKWDGHKCALKVTKFVEKVCKGRKPKCHNEYKVCPYGFEHLHGSCFKFAEYECPHQYEWSSHTNKCFKDSYGFADYICPHGYENEHGKCQKYTKVFAP